MSKSKGFFPAVSLCQYGSLYQVTWAGLKPSIAATW